MKLKKILYVIAGCMAVGLGAVGAVLPLLPSFPFLLLAAFCFAKSSERLHKWFTNTKLYKNNLESYVKGRGMTRKTKIRIMVTMTLLMSVGFIMMDQVPVGRIVLACVWVIGCWGWPSRRRSGWRGSSLLFFVGGVLGGWLG